MWVLGGMRSSGCGELRVQGCSGVWGALALVRNALEGDDRWVRFRTLDGWLVSCALHSVNKQKPPTRVNVTRGAVLCSVLGHRD